MMISNFSSNTPFTELHEALDEILRAPQNYKNSAIAARIVLHSKKISTACIGKSEIEQSIVAMKDSVDTIKLNHALVRTSAALGLESSAAVHPEQKNMHNAKNMLDQVYSVRNICSLLQDVIASAQKFVDDSAVRQALTSQRSLAAYTCNSHLISGMSLNTFKRYANLTLLTGFSGVDILRKRANLALLATVPEPKVKRQNKDELKNKIKELDEKLLTARQDLWIAFGLFLDAMKNARAYANESGIPSLQHRCKLEDEELRKRALLIQTGPEGIRKNER